MTQEERIQAEKAKAASREFAVVPASKRSLALEKMAECLRDGVHKVLAANAKDIEEARSRSAAEKRIRIMTLSENDIRGMRTGNALILKCSSLCRRTDEAIEHINRYRTPHTESIVTESAENAEKFFALVEANVVCHNAATRLTDGMEFGLGGEMGISTQKIPCGGPIGMRTLMQQKYYLKGNGNLR